MPTCKCLLGGGGGGGILIIDFQMCLVDLGHLAAQSTGDTVNNTLHGAFNKSNIDCQSSG